MALPFRWGSARYWGAQSDHDLSHMSCWHLYISASCVHLASIPQVGKCPTRVTLFHNHGQSTEHMQPGIGKPANTCTAGRPDRQQLHATNNRLHTRLTDISHSALHA